MKIRLGRVLPGIAMTGLALVCAAGERPATKSPAKPGPMTYVITNDDTAFPYGNSVTFFLAGGTLGNPDLTPEVTVWSGGYGIAGGFFGTSRVLSLPDSSAPCLYLSDAASADIAAIDLHTQQAAGTFSGSKMDGGTSNGIALAMNASYLYAGFTDSNTIGTFSVKPGCQLTFLSDVSVAGLNGGTINGMALNGNILVVTYGDGSIESFNISGGVPVSNGDEQNSSGYAYDNLPTGVDITQDGHFVIFGDSSVSSVVEVSDISSGKLAPTVAYPAASTNLRIASGASSSSVRLSPDESLLFVSNSQSGMVTAAFFDKETGRIYPGCTSATLNGFYSQWAYVGGLATRDTSGTGGVVYVAEYFAPASWIGILEVSSNGTTCTLTESPSSPAIDRISAGLLSIWAYPPRPF